MYYNDGTPPEGAEFFGDANDLDLHYEFNTFRVYIKGSGKRPTFFWGTDSGCSCPSPFETFTANDWESGTMFQMFKAMDEWATSRVRGNTDANGLRERVLAEMERRAKA